MQQSLFKRFLNIIWNAMCSSHSEVPLAHLSWVHLWRRVSNHILLKTSCFSHFIQFHLVFMELKDETATFCPTHLISRNNLHPNQLFCDSGKWSTSILLQRCFLYCKAGLLLPGEGGSLKKVQKLLLPNYKSVLRSSYLSKVFPSSLNAF